MKHIENALYIIGLLLAILLTFIVFAALVIPVGAWDGDDGYPVEGYPVDTPTLSGGGYPIEPKIAETEYADVTSISNPIQGYPVESYPIEISEPQPEDGYPIEEEKACSINDYSEEKEAYPAKEEAYPVEEEIIRPVSSWKPELFWEPEWWNKGLRNKIR
jgi:hypothetical protein